MSNAARKPNKPGAQIPKFAAAISADWDPGDYIRKHRFFEGMAPEELAILVNDFRDFCTKNRLVRATWGTTFITYSQRRNDPTWKPKQHTDVGA
jgi:hypothetical protein